MSKDQTQDAMQLERPSDEQLKSELKDLTDAEIRNRIKIFQDNTRIMKTEIPRIQTEIQDHNRAIKENQKKLELHTQMAQLVSNVVEILDLEDQDYNGKVKKTKGVVIKTSQRSTYFVPSTGFLDPEKLQPGQIIGVNKDTHLLLSQLPQDYDSRSKAMEVEERPTEDYTDIGGLDKQIEELREAIVLPITHADKFEAIGITPPKGLLMYGPPGTGKTMMARACAAQTQATFLKLAGSQLVQMYIGDGAKIVRDAFALAREKSPAIIFIDELDAIGTKRFNNDKDGDREVQRTMLELLNQLDGFSPDTKIKVIAATNRPDILDPALLRSGRLDRKIEFPVPNEEARIQILKIHSRKMNLDKDVNFEEIGRSTEEFNGAQVKAVCVEAGMLALRRGAKKVVHEDYVRGIQEVQAKKKQKLNYYA